MRTLSDPLLRLMATMSKQEKRYFKLYSNFYQKENGNTCLKLFELIDKAKPSTSTDITALVQNEPYAKNLSLVKNHLSEQILDSLAAFHGPRKNSYMLRRLISHADVLTERGLYSHAEKVLHRAEKKGNGSEEHLLLMDIVFRKRSLLMKHIALSFEQDIHTLYEQAHHVLELILSTIRYQELADLMQVLTAQYAAKPNDTDLVKMQALIETARQLADSSVLSTNAQLHLYLLQGIYALLTNDITQAGTHFRGAILLWQQHPVLIRERGSRYQRYLLNYLNCLVAEDDETRFMNIAEEFRRHCTDSGDNDPLLLRRLWNLELLFYMNRGNLEQCATAIHDIERYMRTYMGQIELPTLVTFCHNCGVYYFLQEKENKALYYMNMIQSELSSDLKRDILMFSRLLSLVIHYELGNIDLLDNMVRSTRRYLKKNDASDVLTRIVTRNISALPGAVGSREQQQIYHTMRTELGRLLHDNSGQEIIGLQELLFWTESKLQRRPVHEIFTEKMAQRISPQEMFPVTPKHSADR